MSTEDRHALASSYVPNSASLVDRCSAAHIPSELKLSTRNLSGMALEDMNGFAWFCIPNLYRKKSTIAVPSKEPVRILSPSALKFKDTISPSCPFNVECSFPVYRSQSLAVWIRSRTNFYGGQKQQQQLSFGGRQKCKAVFQNQYPTT